jgi:hypothetical protein
MGHCNKHKRLSNYCARGDEYKSTMPKEIVGEVAIILLYADKLFLTYD